MTGERGAIAAPTPPVPAVDFKCRCADLWAHPAVRLLLGDALRPGGTKLTGALLDTLDLEPGSRVLDVGSGTGATLEMLGERGATGIGIDYSTALATEASEHGSVTVADAEVLPFAAGAFDAVTAECVVSALPDKQAALRELGRIVHSGGRLALSDVTAEGTLPEPLGTMVSWVACVGGALSAGDHRALLDGAGFDVLAVEDRRDAIEGLLAKARRRVALLQAAVNVGVVPGPESLVGDELATVVDGLAGDEEDLGAVAQRLLAQATEAVDEGALGYVSLVARRR